MALGMVGTKGTLCKVNLKTSLWVVSLACNLTHPQKGIIPHIIDKVDNPAGVVFKSGEGNSEEEGLGHGEYLVNPYQSHFFNPVEICTNSRA